MTDTSRIDSELGELSRELEIITELIRRCVEENAATPQDQSEYAARYNGYVERYEKAESRCDELTAERKSKKSKAKAIERFMKALETREELLTEFDPELWLATVESATIARNGEILFRFFDGSEVKG